MFEKSEKITQTTTRPFNSHKKSFISLTNFNFAIFREDKKNKSRILSMWTCVSVTACRFVFSDFFLFRWRKKNIKMFQLSFYLIYLRSNKSKEKRNRTVFATHVIYNRLHLFDVRFYFVRTRSYLQILVIILYIDSASFFHTVLYWYLHFIYAKHLILTITILWFWCHCRHCVCVDVQHAVLQMKWFNDGSCFVFRLFS